MRHPRSLVLTAIAAVAAAVGIAGPAAASVGPIHRPTSGMPSWLASQPSPSSTSNRTVSSAQLASGHPAVVNDRGTLALKVGTTVQPYDFTGINAYQLTSRWGVNAGCGWGGWSPTTLDEVFASFPANAMVRTWFFQADATSTVNGQSVRNWTATDQLVAEADKYNVHLVLTLGNEAGTCDDAAWKDSSWFAGGYTSVDDQSGAPVGPGMTSYAQWVHDAVSRYAGNPAIAMWEPINEPQPSNCSLTPGWDCFGETTCPSEAVATSSLVTFFTAIGGEIHALDPTKLVSDGSLAGDGCGTGNPTDFDTVISSPGIDVVGYHDYSGMIQPPDLAGRTVQAEALHKPTMIGEAGVTGCASAAQRAQIFTQKIAAAKAVNVSAYLAWWYDSDQGAPTCNSPIDTDSPAWSAILGAAGPVS